VGERDAATVVAGSQGGGTLPSAGPYAILQHAALVEVEEAGVPPAGASACARRRMYRSLSTSRLSC